MSDDFSGVDWQTARYDDKEFTPGDPYEVARLGKRIADTAAMIQEQATKLDNLVDGRGWDSDAGREFRTKTEETVGLLGKTHQRYAAAAGALGTKVGAAPADDQIRVDWATALEHAQNLVRAALTKAKDADAEGTRYQNQIDRHPGDDSHPDKQKLRRQKEGADTDLEAAKKDLRHALSYRDTQAKNVASAIHDAVEHDGLKDPEHHWWDHWKDWVADVGHWAGVAAGVLGVLALVLSWVPVLGEVLAALALVASVVALVCDTVSALDGKGTWLDVAIDAIGVLSFGAGRLLGTTAKEAAIAARGSSALKDFQAAREIGLSRELAGGLAEDLSGVRAGKIGEALAKGPSSLLPKMRSIVKESFNAKAYLDDIRVAAGKLPGEDDLLAKAGDLPIMKTISDSAFKGMATSANRLYWASQTLPLAAGISNLAPVEEWESRVTGPDLLGGLKDIPGVGANGIPFYNWHWTPAGA
ncbi:hypothetical protein AB0I77_32880 [Streptomyces sp. NPDC050619]|uniref:hypothetical protein n=1 Tax=Streptomyces sp. NPDC050619 TaxID=3157214 RepID=UPI0034403460